MVLDMGVRVSRRAAGMSPPRAHALRTSSQKVTPVTRNTACRHAPGTGTHVEAHARSHGSSLDDPRRVLLTPPAHRDGLPVLRPPVVSAQAPQAAPARGGLRGAAARAAGARAAL